MDRSAGSLAGARATRILYRPTKGPGATPSILGLPVGIARSPTVPGGHSSQGRPPCGPLPTSVAWPLGSRAPGIALGQEQDHVLLLLSGLWVPGRTPLGHRRPQCPLPPPKPPPLRTLLAGAGGRALSIFLTSVLTAALGHSAPHPRGDVWAPAKPSAGADALCRVRSACWDLLRHVRQGQASQMRWLLMSIKQAGATAQRWPGCDSRMPSVCIRTAPEPLLMRWGGLL